MDTGKPNQSNYQLVYCQTGREWVEELTRVLSLSLVLINIFINKLSTYFKSADETAIGKAVSTIEEHKWYLEESWKLEKSPEKTERTQQVQSTTTRKE